MKSDQDIKQCGGAGPGSAVLPACRACCTKLVQFGVSLGGHAVLDDINLHMHCGEMTVLIGPNGGGKTTLLRAMLGEVPHCGTLQFLPSGTKQRRSPRIGYVPQRIDFDPTSPASVFDLFCAATSRKSLIFGYQTSALRQAAAALGIVDAAHLLRAQIRALSGGELQRVLLALALTPVPDILLLDEPLSGVDQAGIAVFYQTISALREKYDLSVLLISHDLRASVQVADRFIFLNRRILADGTPEEVLRSSAVKEYFGLSIEISALPAPHRILHHHSSRTENRND